MALSLPLNFLSPAAPFRSSEFSFLSCQENQASIRPRLPLVALYTTNKKEIKPSDWDSKVRILSPIMPLYFTIMALLRNSEFYKGQKYDENEWSIDLWVERNIKLRLTLKDKKHRLLTNNFVNYTIPLTEINKT